MTDAAIEQRPEVVRRPARRVLLGSVRELALVPAIAVLFVIGIFTSPAFFTAANFSNTAQFSAALGMVVVAESLILLTGSFDLSLQSIYGLAPMIGAWLIVPKDAQGLGTDWNPAVGILVVIGVGAAVGLFNGFMIVKLRFNAFIFTLAMLILLAGVQQGIVSGQTIYEMPPSFIYLGSAYWGGFPVSAWVTAAFSSRPGCSCATTATAARSTRSAATSRPRARPASRSTASASASSSSPARWPRSRG